MQRQVSKTTSAAIELLARGFAEMEIDRSILGLALPTLIKGMEKITDSPENRSLFPMKVVMTDEVGWKMEAALVRRDNKDESGNRENKFFFHHHPLYAPESKEAHERFSDFLSTCDYVGTHAKSIALDIAHAIDTLHADQGRTCPNLYNAIRQSHVVTRVLRYLDQDEHSADAYTHLDRGVLTVHWYATHPGLVLFDRWGEKHRISETELDRVAIFPSKKFAALFPSTLGHNHDRGHCRYGTLHGVSDPRRRNGTRTADRYSLVSFVHAKLPDQAVEWLQLNKAAMDAFEKAHPL